MNPSLNGLSGGVINEIEQPVRVPVAAFPLRGRCNPYCTYLLPLVLLRSLLLVKIDFLIQIL